MSRIYGQHKCTHCNRPSRLGWVYNCTQDNCDHTNEVEEGLHALISNLTTNHQVKAVDPGQDGTFDSHIIKLSPWMEKAISDGHYTEEQVAILRAQRQKVTNCIAAADSESVRGQKAKKPQPTPVQTASATSNLNLPSSSDDELPTGSALNEPRILHENDNRFSSTHLQKIVPACSYKTCQICRPVSRDRAWGCFDHIFQEVIKPSSLAFHDVNRPISNATLVRRLGLRASKPQSEMFGFYPGESVANGEADDKRTNLENYLAEVDNSHVNTLNIKRTRSAGPFGFRASARRSIRSMLISPRRPSTHSQESKDSRNSGRKKSVRDNAFVRFIDDLSSDQRNSGEYDLGSSATRKSWKRKNGMTVCTNTRSALKDEKEEKVEEVYVPGGIAVTEEAADLGTADIIMQV